MKLTLKGLDSFFGFIHLLCSNRSLISLCSVVFESESEGDLGKTGLSCMVRWWSLPVLLIGSLIVISKEALLPHSDVSSFSFLAIHIVCVLFIHLD